MLREVDGVGENHAMLHYDVQTGEEKLEDLQKDFAANGGGMDVGGGRWGVGVLGCWGVGQVRGWVGGMDRVSGGSG